jgi:membrane-associated phospholipid phosphatase
MNRLKKSKQTSHNEQHGESAASQHHRRWSLIDQERQWRIDAIKVMVLCFVSYLSVDIPVAVCFHRFENGDLYEIFSIITLFGDSLGYLVGGLLLFALFRTAKPYWAQVGLFLFSTVAASGLVADLIKFIAGRSRPKILFSEYFSGFAFFRWEHDWTSFPSGHSATAFSVAMLVALLFPRWRRIALIAGGMVAFSRIFLVEHFVSDVIAGSFIGIISTLFLYERFFESKLERCASKNSLKQSAQ